MKQFSIFIKWFLYITASILIIVTVSFTLAGEEVLPTNTLWHILLASFLTTIVTWLFSPENEILYGNPKSPLSRLNEKLGLPVQILLHFILLCAVMIPCGILFGWASKTPRGILFMILTVGIVYLLVYGATYLIDFREADAINRRIEEKYKD